MGKIRDRIDRRVVITDEFAEAFEEAVGGNRNGRVPQTKFAHDQFDFVLFVVTCVFVDDGKSVDVVAQFAFRGADQRI